MKSKRMQTIILAALIILCLAAGVFFEYEKQLKRRFSTPVLSPDELDVISDILFLFPADENPSLPSDIYTTVFEEDQLRQYLIVSHDFNIKKAVCYAVDPAGQYLSRYVISFSDGDEYAIGLRNIILTYTDLPVLSIDIAPDSPSIEELDASDKTVECRADLVLAYDKETASANNWPKEIRSRGDNSESGTVGITGRGNVSWYYSPKKSYSLSFNEPTYLPGLGQNRKWNLISNSQDKSLLNNEVFYRMATITGIEYEPSYMQVSVYLNGRYHGVYMITSKMSVDPERIALKGGDFLMNFGDPDTSHAIYYETKMWMDDEATAKPYVNIKWPKDYSSATVSEQKGIIQRFISSVEDPADYLYTDYMDLDSMVRYYWIQEISMNYDADYRSAYAYYRRSTDKIYMGPVWDLDIAMGWNADKFGADFTTPQGWKVRNMSFYACLFEHEDFARAVSDMYWNGGIREAMYDALERYKLRYSEMAEDGRLNYRRWRTDWPALALRMGDNYDDECAGRIAFFTDRVNWIDEEMSRMLTITE